MGDRASGAKSSANQKGVGRSLRVKKTLLNLFGLDQLADPRSRHRPAGPMRKGKGGSVLIKGMREHSLSGRCEKEDLEDKREGEPLRGNRWRIFGEKGNHGSPNL